jgi:hypothetical protein
MSEFERPLVVCDGGDLIVFDRLEDLESQIEAYDVRAGRYEFFDGDGKPLVASVDGYRVHLHADPTAVPERERLEARLRSYLTALGARRPRLAGYAHAAERATSLQELLELRLKLSKEPRYGFWCGVRRRLGGNEDEVSA